MLIEPSIYVAGCEFTEFTATKLSLSPAASGISDYISCDERTLSFHVATFLRVARRSVGHEEDYNYPVRNSSVPFLGGLRSAKPDEYDQSE